MNNKKKFIFVFFSFYPENIPYNHIILEIIKYLLGRNCEVELITYQQSQEQITQLKEINEIRDLKITYIKKYFNHKDLSYLWFTFMSFYKCLIKKNCTILTPSTPPVLMLFSITLAKFITSNRFKLIYHCQDIHPEALGLIKPKNFIYYILEKIEKFSLRKTDLIITLSEEMMNVLNKKTKIKKIKIIDNYIPTKPNNQLSEKKQNHGEIKLIYSGNIGSFQNIEMLVDIILEDSINISLTIIGNGSHKNEIAKKIQSHKNHKKVILLDPVNLKDIGNIISEHDFGVISLIPNMLNYAKPSKMQSYLSEGVPLFFISDKNTSLEKLIAKENLGIYCYSDNKTSIIDALSKLKSFETNKENIIHAHNKINSRERLLFEFYTEITNI